jgi:hypothetical protein
MTIAVLVQTYWFTVRNNNAGYDRKVPRKPQLYIVSAFTGNVKSATK